MDNAKMDGMVAVLIAALAFAHGAAPAYTIQLERLLAPTVNGHPLAPPARRITHLRRAVTPRGLHSGLAEARARGEHVRHRRRAHHNRELIPCESRPPPGRQ